MHCFIGLEVQEPLSSSILEVDHNWSQLGFAPADFHKHTYPHITLVPPFDTTDADRLIAGLTQVVAAFPQFDADYARINAFNHRIVHVEVDSNGLTDLRIQLYGFGKGTFVYQDNHPIFHPHTTVAYMHNPLTAPELATLAGELETRLELPQHQEVTHVHLYGRNKPTDDYRTLVELKLSDNS